MILNDELPAVKGKNAVIVDFNEAPEVVINIQIINYDKIILTKTRF
jgi:hypothetical protein